MLIFLADFGVLGTQSGILLAERVDNFHIVSHKTLQRLYFVLKLLDAALAGDFLRFQLSEKFFHLLFGLAIFYEDRIIVDILRLALVVFELAIELFVFAGERKLVVLQFKLFIHSRSLFKLAASFECGEN